MANPEMKLVERVSRFANADGTLSAQLHEWLPPNRQTVSLRVRKPCPPGLWSEDSVSVTTWEEGEKRVGKLGLTFVGEDKTLEAVSPNGEVSRLSLASLDSCAHWSVDFIRVGPTSHRSFSVGFSYTRMGLEVDFETAQIAARRALESLQTMTD